MNEMERMRLLGLGLTEEEIAGTYVEETITEEIDVKEIYASYYDDTKITPLGILEVISSLLGTSLWR